MTQIIHEELSRKIIGAAMEVFNELKRGLDVALFINFKNARPEWKRVLRANDFAKVVPTECMPDASYPWYPCNPWLMNSF